jgi:hypothetical protein
MLVESSHTYFSTCSTCHFEVLSLMTCLIEAPQFSSSVGKHMA